MIVQDYAIAIKNDFDFRRTNHYLTMLLDIFLGITVD